ncbi:hypothetical protein Avbf_04728, partial [Armadillidium vulgare]
WLYVEILFNVISDTIIEIVDKNLDRFLTGLNSLIGYRSYSLNSGFGFGCGCGCEYLLITNQFQRKIMKNTRFQFRASLIIYHKTPTTLRSDKFSERQQRRCSFKSTQSEVIIVQSLLLADKMDVLQSCFHSYHELLIIQQRVLHIFRASLNGMHINIILILAQLKSGSLFQNNDTLSGLKFNNNEIVLIFHKVYY